MISEITSNHTMQERREIFRTWRDAGILWEDVEYRRPGEDVWQESLCYKLGDDPNGRSYYRVKPEGMLISAKTRQHVLDSVREHRELMEQEDVVNHPTHYTSHPSGVECKDIIAYFPFFVGAAIKYLWRAGLKGDAVEDYRKAIKCIEFEIEKLEKHNDSSTE